MASMTGNHVAQQLRWITDDSEPFKPANDILPAMINAAVNRVLTSRPDALCSSTGTLNTLTPITTLSGTLSLDDTWLMAVTHAVASVVFQGGGSSTKDPVKAAEQERLYALAVAGK